MVTKGEYGKPYKVKHRYDTIQATTKLQQSNRTSQLRVLKCLHMEKLSGGRAGDLQQTGPQLKN